MDGAFQNPRDVAAYQPRIRQPGKAILGAVPEGREGSPSSPAGWRHGAGYNSFYAARPESGVGGTFFQAVLLFNTFK